MRLVTALDHQAKGSLADLEGEGAEGLDGRLRATFIYAVFFTV